MTSNPLNNLEVKLSLNLYVGLASVVLVTWFLTHKFNKLGFDSISRHSFTERWSGKLNKLSDRFLENFPFRTDRTPTGKVKNKLHQMAVHSALCDESAKRMCQSANRFSSTSLMYPWVWPGCLCCVKPPTAFENGSRLWCSMKASFSTMADIWWRSLDQLSLPTGHMYKTCPVMPHMDKMPSYLVCSQLERLGSSAIWLL